MKNVKRLGKLGLPLLLMSFLLSCAGGKPAGQLGIVDAKLTACPSSPNCVSSDAADSDHSIAPFRISGSPGDAWQIAQNQVAALPRTKIVTAGDNYLHAECRSAVFGFVDDLELHLRPEERIMAVRSAARLGYSDLGVNRDRVEKLRAELINQGVVD